MRIEVTVENHNQTSINESWEHIKQNLIKDINNLPKREIDVQESYINELARISNEWVSMEDYILHHIFDCPYELNHVTGKYRIAGEPQKRWAFVPNNYPYNWPDSIQHWVLWFIETPSDDEIQTILSFYFEHTTDYFIWRNTPEKQTVPQVQHFQVIFPNYAKKPT